MVMLRKTLLAAAAALVTLPTWAAITAQEAARLGADLTPLGAEKAGNADGTIPEWTGGIKSPADAGFPNYKTGQHHPDPFAQDKPLFTITASNVGQYAAKLTEGHKKLFETYKDYKMNVYPTRRSAAFPQRIYDATKRVALFRGGLDRVDHGGLGRRVEAPHGRLVDRREVGERRTLDALRTHRAELDHV